MAKAKTPARMTTAEAADYLGITTDELMRSRWRGLEPGKLGFKAEGQLWFNRADLPKPPAKAKPADD